MRFFIYLAYLGAPFHGWQVQPGEITVQGEIERVLSTILRRPVGITGAGRTDTGVNARMMTAHVDLTNEEIERIESITQSMRAMLAPNIAIYSVMPVSNDAHARFDATERTYRYFARTIASPFDAHLTWKAPSTLDFEAMNLAAKQLLGTHDFTSFAKLHSDARTNICTVTRAEWFEVESGKWAFEISANRFLRNMVRAVVGTLVEVGRHKIAPDDILRIMQEQNRCSAGTSMPGEALFLWDVKYPYISF